MNRERARVRCPGADSKIVENYKLNGQQNDDDVDFNKRRWYNYNNKFYFNRLRILFAVEEDPSLASPTAVLCGAFDRITVWRWPAICAFDLP